MVNRNAPYLSNSVQQSIANSFILFNMSYHVNLIMSTSIEVINLKIIEKPSLLLCYFFVLFLILIIGSYVEITNRLSNFID